MNDTFWEIVCGMVPSWYILAIVDVVIIFLLLLSFPFLDQNSGAFVAAIFTFVIVGFSLALYIAIVGGCVRRGEISIGD